MSRTRGLGDRGGFLDIGCVPDATLEAAIDALIIAKTDVVGKLVSLTWLNNYEVAITANDAIPDGEIIQCVPSGSTYDLTVRLFSYIDQNSVRHTPVCIINLPYDTGTIALQDSIIVNGSTYMNAEDGGSGGWGAVIAKDTASLTVDVLF